MGEFSCLSDPFWRQLTAEQTSSGTEPKYQDWAQFTGPVPDPPTVTYLRCFPYLTLPPVACTGIFRVWGGNLSQKMFFFFTTKSDGGP